MEKILESDSNLDLSPKSRSGSRCAAKPFFGKISCCATSLLVRSIGLYPAMVSVHAMMMVLLILAIGMMGTCITDSGVMIEATAATGASDSKADGARSDQCVDANDESCKSENVDDEFDEDLATGDAGTLRTLNVVFKNEWARPVSLYWSNEEDDVAKVVVKSIPVDAEQPMNTFVGHVFFFSVEGTGSRIGEFVTMQEGKELYTLPSDAKVVEEEQGGCVDRYARRCKREADLGYCDQYPGWMTVNCPQACNRCELLDPKKRCDRKRLNVTEEPWFKPGDLNKLFEEMPELTKMYEPVIVSRPPEGPWIIYFDKFLMDEEVNAFIKWGNKLGFERSTDTGPQNARGESQKLVSKTRTSENAWCREDCMKDPLVAGVTKRIEEVTKTPAVNYEDYQILRYQTGQYYKVHHDMSENNFMNYGGGPRTLTFFLYLSDVEEGGETNFPRLDIKVAPKKGRAVLWPSVMDENSYKQDPRTYHEALPVIKGLKYAANHWIHSNNYKMANLWGCGGAFD